MRSLWERDLREEAEAEGIAQGIAKGVAQGIAQGVAQGRAEEKAEHTKALYARVVTGDIAVEIAADILGMTVPQFQEAARKLCDSIDDLGGQDTGGAVTGLQ